MLTKIHSVVFYCAFMCSFFHVSAQHHSASTTKAANGLTIFSAQPIKTVQFELPSSGELQEKQGEQILFSASVKHHKLHGNWQSYYSVSQKMDEGYLVKGVPDGLWQVWYPNGQLKAIRTYSASLFFSIQQDVELNHPKLSRFAVTELSKKEGTKVLQVLSATYSFNNSSYTSPQSPVELVIQNRNHPEHYHPPFSNVLHHGLYVNYFESGSVKDSGYYKNGLKDGIWLHRSASNNSVWKGSYNNGIKQKEWKLYNAAGKLTLIVFYSNEGEEEWRKSF